MYKLKPSNLFKSTYLSLASVLVLSACFNGEDSNTPPASTTNATGATKPILTCNNSNNQQKQPFFGDLHIHTKLSFDAYFFNSINGPREAYRFAQGDPGFLPSGEDPNTPTRQIQLDRPLDFAAVTEHAEQLGSFANLCEAQGRLPEGTNPACEALGQIIRDNVRTFVSGNVPIYLQLVTTVGRNLPSTTTWQQIQDIANEQYQPCKFTTFSGYEFSSNKGGQVLHRNVIFRSDTVPENVVSSIPPPT